MREGHGTAFESPAPRSALWKLAVCAAANWFGVDLALHAPRQQMPARQFRSVFVTDRLRLSVLGHDRVQHPRYSSARSACIHFQR